eukprot:1052084_1
MASADRHRKDNEHDEIPEEKQAPTDQPTWLYFGYGSNMSYSNLTNVKGIKPISMFRGIIQDMKLTFSLQSILGEVFANLEACDGVDVHGVILELSQTDMNRMVRIERGYDRRTMNAYYYPEDVQTQSLSTNLAKVEVFIADQNSKNTKETTQEMLPSKNYLQTLLNGANEMQLQKSYFDQLAKQPFLKEISFKPTKEQESAIQSKTFKMTDVLDKSNALSVIKGIVWDLSECAGVAVALKLIISNKDITYTVTAKRWAAYLQHAKNLKSIDDISKYDALKEYVNDCVHKLALVPGVKIVGKLATTERYCYEYYDW